MSFGTFAHQLSRVFTFALLLSLGACGGGSSSSSTTTPITDCTSPSASDQNGCAYVNLTDAPGDFLSYTVNVTGLTLTRADGTIVNVLPNATTVDFAQYSDLSEFLSLASMPPGSYTSGSITLDYTNADIQVADTNGNAVQVAPVNSNGNAITTLTLSIDLDNTAALVLVPGVPRLFQVDFDLAASNTVNLNVSGEPTTVTVQPFLSASVDPNLTNQIQVRGPLTTVDASDGEFTLGLRPFYAISGDYGAMRIFTDSNTVFDINQTAFSGSAGITALAAAGPTTAVIAKGTFDFTSHEFQASEVDAGSSVPGGTLDAAEGVILSRSGDDIVLRGATLYRAGQTAIFRDSVAVTLGTSTKVHEAGSPKSSFDISDISVGQRLLVFGKLTNTSPSSLALDASSGFARLQYTKFDGTVNPTPTATSMSVNVQYIEGRPVSMFSFAGTGTSTPNDANPSTYAVSSSSGLFNGVNTGDPVRVWGFATPFGSAPPDFTATTVADYVNANGLIVMSWPSPGSTDVFTSMSATSGLVLNLASTPPPPVSELVQGGVVTQLSHLSNGAPTVKGTLGVFAISQNGTVQVHVTLEGFLSDLTARLSGGAKVRAFFVHGGFDGNTDTMTAKQIAVVVQ